MNETAQPQPEERDKRPADRLREAYRRWHDSRGRSADEIIGMMGENCVMRTVLNPQEVPSELASAHRSRAEIQAYFDDLAKDWEMIGYPTERIIDGGDDVVFVGRCIWRNRETGKLVDTPKVDVWRFENGEAVDFLEMFDSQAFTAALAP